MNNTTRNKIIPKYMQDIIECKKENKILIEIIKQKSERIIQLENEIENILHECMNKHEDRHSE